MKHQNIADFAINKRSSAGRFSSSVILQKADVDITINTFIIGFLQFFLSAINVNRDKKKRFPAARYRKRKKVAVRAKIVNICENLHLN